MVILVKIAKIGQLRMALESREPIMYSGFLLGRFPINKTQKLRQFLVFVKASNAEHFFDFDPF